MFEFKLRPEIRKQLKNPDLFIKGQEKLHWGLILMLSGVIMMGILVFQDPEKSTHPFWLILVGLALAFWGEIQKFRAK